MTDNIHMLSLAMPFGMGMVNAYLVKTSTGHLLIDSGAANARRELLGRLEELGCSRGSLELVILTHGDFDHTGNAGHLQSAFGSKTAMHPDDSGMVEHGDMFLNRRRPNLVLRTLLPCLSGFGKSERFKPDMLIQDGYSLDRHGLAARVLSLPGHSRGSIAVMTVDGDLFCGDLLVNIKHPMLNSLLDDRAAAEESLGKLRKLSIRTIYPGHGQPFHFRSLDR